MTALWQRIFGDRATAPEAPVPLDLSPEARAEIKVPLRGKDLCDRSVVLEQETASLRGLSEASGNEVEFKKYFPSVEVWVHVMGCLPSKARTDEEYHDLFNDAYRQLQKATTWPGIINSHEHKGLKLLPLKVLDQDHLTELMILDVPLLGLPKDLGQVNSLKQLTLLRTKVQRLPDSIFEKEIFECLDLRETPLDNFAKAQERIFNLKKGITVI